MDDDELTRLAEQELIREAKVGEARAAVHGVMGWLRDKTPRTNKRFLSTTISHALQHNHRQRSVGSMKDNIQEQQRRDKVKPKKQVVTSPVKSPVNNKVKLVCHKSKSHHNPKRDHENSSSAIQKTGCRDRIQKQSKNKLKLKCT